MKRIILFLAVTSFAVAGENFSGDAAVIAKARAASNAAIAAHDAGLVASFLTEDAQVTSGNGASWRDATPFGKNWRTVQRPA